MKGYRQTSYGDSYVDGYEAANAKLPDPGPMVEVLARYAKAGPALELGIGSGRVARPLAARRIEVDGIEISPVMIEQLNNSTEGSPVRAIRGTFADFESPRRYPLVYCTLNTFFNLTTREEQIRAFAAVTHALDDGGCFILEAHLMPGLRHMAQGFRLVELAADSVTLQFAHHDENKQIIEAQRVVLGAEGITLHPWVVRYALPDELDEMASQVGLHLRARWADWGAESLTDESRMHVSVYARNEDHER